MYRLQLLFLNGVKRHVFLALFLALGLRPSNALWAAPVQNLPQPTDLKSGWMLQNASRINQSGKAISSADFQPNGWLEATVPGTVLTSLVNDGIYPEPLYGTNNDTIPDTLCRTTWWYRTTFTPSAAYAGKHVWLTFHGINYMADVWVNGHKAGTIKGAFARGIFDVTSDVAVGVPNVLAVHIFPEPHPGRTHTSTIAGGTVGGGKWHNGGVTAQDGPTFLCSVGWVWIPTIRDRDSGIWQGVTLSASGPVVLQNPYVTSKLPLPEINSADLTVQTTISNVTDSVQRGTLAGHIGEVSFTRPFSLPPHEIRTITFSPPTTPALHVEHPRLWWPNGYGPQNLYQLRLTASVNNEISDARDTRFGIRQIGYFQPGSTKLSLSVNGVRVIAKGGDWGMDEAMKRNPRKRLEAEIRLHQLAHYTIIRNWVGQSTSEEFYDLCDKYGILVWDEFFQPNPGDGPEPDDTNLYLANVREKILRFRDHPCIALWCGRNEGNPPPVINDANRRLVSELDPDRLYQPSSTSGHGVISWGPYGWQTPEAFYGFGNWEVFKTEIGCESIPTLESIQAMMPATDWKVVNNDWALHGFDAHYLDILNDRYGPLASLADFVRKSQLANYEDFRALYEARFARLFNPVTGIITWMSDPAEPCFLWQIYDYDLEPNASYFAVRKACEPIHVMMDQTNWHVMVINSTAAPLEHFKESTTVYNLDGSLQYRNVRLLTAAPDAATDLGEIDFPAGLSVVHFVKLELRDAHERLISDNFYWRALPAHPGDFTALNQMAMVPLEVKARQREANGKCLLKVTLRNPANSIALMAHLQLRQASSGKRVLPVFYSDNYLSLTPGERREITIEAARSDLHGQEPMLVVDGWNVTVKPVSASGKEVEVEPNSEALVAMPVAAAVGGQPGNISINCGGGPPGFFRFGAPGSGFVGDRDFQGGNTQYTPDPMDVSAAHAASADVYQTERWGDCTYTIPVVKGHACTVRLHFAEVRYGPGRRKFNVLINGQRVLTEFDIAAEAGKDKALVKDFKGVEPDAKGNIVITFKRGSADFPKICGIQILE